MPTKKQLEDAARCGARILGECVSCGMHNVIDKYEFYKAPECAEMAAKTALAYRKMLERLEWTGQTRHGIGLAPSCPICEMAKSEGHADMCELAALLKGCEE